MSYKSDWYKDWSYVVNSSGEGNQYQCTFYVPNSATSLKQLVVTDDKIASLLMSAFTTLTEKDKEE